MPDHLYMVFGLFTLLNAFGLLAALILFLVFLWRNIPKGRAFALSCFFAIGLAVGRLQWMIYSNADQSEIGWNIFATVPSVAVMGILAFVVSLRRLQQDRLLGTMFVLMALLGVLQFSGSPVYLLNSYARFFAFLCIVVPLFVLARSGHDSFN